MGWYVKFDMFRLKCHPRPEKVEIIAHDKKSWRKKRRIKGWAHIPLVVSIIPHPSPETEDRKTVK